MPTSADVRSQLIDALRLDLVGPRPGEPAHARYAEEVLPIAPSNWYLTGFLVPYEAPTEQRSDPDSDDELDQASRLGAGDDENTPEQASARKAFFPSSIGLSVLVSQDTAQLQVKVAWGDYAPVVPGEDEARGRKKRGHWQRRARESEVVVDLDESDEPSRVELPGSGGLQIVLSVHAESPDGLLPGTRSVAVFLVNHREAAPDATRSAAYVFQPELSLVTLHPFVARPNLRGRHSDDPDEKVADLQYRDAYEYAVGHNVSAVAVTGAATGGEVRCREVRTSWMPTADVEKVIASKIPGVRLGMEALATAADADEIRQRVGKMVTEYGAWIDRQRQIDPGDAPRRQTAADLMTRAERANDRIQAGLDLLDEPDVLEAFRLTNQVIATAIRQRSCHDKSGQRPEDLDPLMRYTLRLLTLDQLGRAANLICALELERQQDVEKLGSWPFEIGLWVGQTATPNRMGKLGDKDRYSARARTIAFQNDDRRKPSPIPLENCPWCGTKFNKNSFQLLPDPNEPQDLRVFCISRRCAFHPRRQQAGLPILAVDDPIYRRLPAFIVATVDKFANLPWVGETAGLFGRVERYDKDGFYGPSRPGVGRALPSAGGALAPLDLVIQDELHLISGPLGTMVGLYETAIDALCQTPPGSQGVKPKIVASTATVRRAEKQIRGLFGRFHVDIFPPPGPDRRNSFFAETVGPEERNPRTYLGLAAQGRNLKVVLLRTYLALLAAGQKAWQESGGVRNQENPADPYMTLVGYFNSLRELGGSRRIVEDEVHSRLADYSVRRLRVGDTRGLFADRKRLTEPRELTSRVSTNEVAETKRRLALCFHDKEHVDVALATNMISVGLDITRLGLMVVLGQPKTAAEYIQATSRVGRDDERPGLVVTLLNMHRPRDRSHYESFAAWHESFYRAVEAASVTPFSPRAIDRGLAGITVALARLGHNGLTAPAQAAAITQHRTDLDFVAEVISRRAEAHDKDLSADDAEALRQKVRGRVVDLLDTWASIAGKKGELQYQREVGVLSPLLFDPLDPELDKQPKEARNFTANRSLRDVEPAVKLWLRNPDSFDDEAGR